MKKIVYIIFFLLFNFQLTIAQHIPIRSNFSTPHGNITTVQYVRMPYYNRGIGVGISTHKYSYTIHFRNDSSATVFSKIDFSDSIHFIKSKQNGEKVLIYPKDTKKISCVSDVGRKYTGIPSDSCWLFKVETGLIDSYAYLPEDNPACIIAFQYGINEPIQALTKENLLPIVSKKPQATKLAEKNKLLPAIKAFNEGR